MKNEKSDITVLLDGYEVSVPLEALGKRRWRGVFIPEEIVPLEANIYPYQKTQFITQCEHRGKQGWYITFYHRSFEASPDGVSPIIYIADKRDATQNKEDEKNLKNIRETLRKREEEYRSKVDGS